MKEKERKAQDWTVGCLFFWKNHLNHMHILDWELIKGKSAFGDFVCKNDLNGHKDEIYADN